MGINYKGSHGQAERAVVLQEEEEGPPGWGLGVRLTTSPCRNKLVENLLRKKS
jgi:hypothetical protein